jgi:Ni/Fe-hydrogenase subunit HybB-like protein
VAKKEIILAGLIHTHDDGRIRPKFIVVRYMRQNETVVFNTVYVCMYVCVCVCMYVCIYVCMYCRVGFGLVDGFICLL